MSLQDLPMMYIWDDRMLYIGRLSKDSEFYSSSVFLFGLSLGGKITLKNDQHDSIECTSFLVPPKVSHQVLCTSHAPMVWVQIEPMHKDCLLLQQQMRKSFGRCYVDFLPAAQAETYFLDLYQNPFTSEDAHRQLCMALNLNHIGENPYTIKDVRVLKVMEHINNNLFDNVLTQELADNVGLSAGRMQKLFKQQAKMSVRQYRLWKRLKYASKISFQRESFVDAAFESGFSDAAHFSRAFRQQFGRSASSMLGKSTGTMLINS